MIYRLERTGKMLLGEISRMIVRASQEKVAREFASKHCGKEGPSPWLDAKQSPAEVIDEMGKPEIIDSIEVW